MRVNARCPLGRVTTGSRDSTGTMWPANHNRSAVVQDRRRRNCGGPNESTRPLVGLGSGEWYESRFLRKCIDGGHAGIGHRCRAVGNQDFLRRVNSRELASNKRPLVKKEVRDNGVTSAAAEAFCSSCRRVCRHSSFQRVGVWLGIPSGPKAALVSSLLCILVII